MLSKPKEETQNSIFVTVSIGVVGRQGGEGDKMSGRITGLKEACPKLGRDGLEWDGSAVYRVFSHQNVHPSCCKVK